MTEIEDVYLAIDNARRVILERLPDVPADQPPPRRKHLTKDDVLAAHLAALTKASPDHHSVTLKTNAKHEVQVEITVRAAAGSEFETPAQAFAEASRLLVQAREVFALAGIPVAPQEAVSDGGKA